jgi:hypothetical protein
VWWVVGLSHHCSTRLSVAQRLRRDCRMNHATGAKRFSTVLLRRLVPVRAVRMVRGPREPAFHRTPLMGFVKDAPPPTSPGESTPERTVARSSVRCVPSRALVPPLPFHPTPTVSSSPCSAGLLHPAAGHGVRRVSMLAGGTEIPRDGTEHLLYGACPSKLFPRQQPYRVTAAVPFPLLDGARRSSRPKSRAHRFPPQPQGLAPLAKPLRTLRRCQQSVARCFHGLLVLGRALARPAAPKSHGCLISGEPGTRASRSPTGGPEGRQPPSPMVPIDSAERSRRFELVRVRLAERRADTEVPPVLEGMMQPEGHTSPRNVRVDLDSRGNPHQLQGAAHASRNPYSTPVRSPARAGEHAHLPSDHVAKPWFISIVVVIRPDVAVTSASATRVIERSRTTAADGCSIGRRRTSRRPCRRLTQFRLAVRRCRRPVTGSSVLVH